MKNLIMLLVTTLIITIIISSFTTVHAATENDTIYTSLPAKNDQYYKKIHGDLISYNKALFNQRDNNHFKCITKEKLPFPTSDYTYDDIWIRDVAPVITTKMVKFKYCPSYLSKSTGNYLNQSFITWLNNHHFQYQSSAIKLDGGNLQWNGDKTIVLTTKVLKDNPNYSKKELINELKTKLAVNKVVLISPEPGDVLGHADGMIKFISPNQAFISDFEGDKHFYNKVVKQMQQQMPEVKLIPLKSQYTEQGQADAKIASAKGLYINMLETPTTIYVPTFNLSNDDKNIETIQKYTNKKVVPISVDKISTYGGALHCTTWEVPAKFNPSK